MKTTEKTMRRLAVFGVVLFALGGWADDVVQETATIEFDPAVLSSWDASRFPAWVRKAGTEDGRLDREERCWVADEALPPGRGQCWIDIDRNALRADLGLTLLFEATTETDVAVQLWDDTSRVVAVDLFMNVIEESTWFNTHTFIIPLMKYPSASRIVIRRISGRVKIHGVVLTPVLSEAEGDFGELLALARTLGDPLSPENPVVRAVRGTSQKKPQPPSPAIGPAASPPNTLVERRSADSTRTTDPAGMVAYYDFEKAATAEGLVRDESGNGHDLQVRGQPVSFISGVSGKAALLDGSYFETQRNPLEDTRDFTISIWFKTGSPTANYKLAAAAWWSGGKNASGWNIGTHYSEFWADNQKGGLDIRTGWERRVSFHRGEWNHLVVVYNGTAMREYINGQLSFECPGTGRSAGAGRPMTVGSWNGGFLFRGVMDELRLYRRALGEDEIVALFHEAGS